MKNSNGVSNKEKNIFLAGVSAGIVGGLLGNFLVAFFFKFFDNPSLKSNWVNLIIFVIFTAIFFWALFWINSKIKQTSSNKKLPKPTKLDKMFWLTLISLIITFISLMVVYGEFKIEKYEKNPLIIVTDNIEGSSCPEYYKTSPSGPINLHVRNYGIKTIYSIELNCEGFYCFNEKDLGNKTNNYIYSNYLIEDNGENWLNLRLEKIPNYKKDFAFFSIHYKYKDFNGENNFNYKTCKYSVSEKGEYILLK